MAGNEIGYYTLPVILSMEGVEKQVSSKLSRAFGDVGKKAGKALSDGSEEEVKKAIASYGKLRDKAQDALGKIRIEEEKLNKARAAGKPDQIIAADPLHVDALTLRGWTLVRIDDPELQAQGVESLDTALAQNPSTFDPYLFRGFVARNLELDLPRAIELYELALEHNPPPAMEVQISANIEEMQAELNA